MTPGTRVALLHPCFWPEVRRGAERIIRELADGLVGEGMRPRLLTSHPGPPSRAVEDGLEVVRHWRPPDGRLRRRRYEDHLTHVPFSYASLLRGDDALAHAFFPTDGAAAARWGESTRRPVIFTYMGIPKRSYLASRRTRLAATLAAIRGSDAVVALSRTAADAFRRTLGVKAEVVHPGVDLARFPLQAGRSEAPSIFCAAPVDEPMKRVSLLVEALPLVRRERPGTLLWLMRPADPRAAAGLEALDGVELVDWVSDAGSLAHAYGDAWVSALPSSADSFGLVLAESLACGTPVAASDQGAIPEVVDRPEIGRLFAEPEPQHVARTLLETLELSEDPATGAACRARAEDFSTQRATAAYLELYGSVLDA